MADRTIDKSAIVVRQVENNSPSEILTELLRVVGEAPHTKYASSEQKHKIAIRASKLVKYLRESLNLTPMKMAAASGISIQTIYRWEDGTIMPRLYYIKKLESLIRTNPQDKILRSFTEASDAFLVTYISLSPTVILGLDHHGPGLKLPNKFKDAMKTNLVRAMAGDFKMRHFVPTNEAALGVWKLWHDLSMDVLGRKNMSALLKEYSFVKQSPEHRFVDKLTNFLNSREEFQEVYDKRQLPAEKNR